MAVFVSAKVCKCVCVYGSVCLSPSLFLFFHCLSVCVCVCVLDAAAVCNLLSESISFFICSLSHRLAILARQSRQADFSVLCCVLISHSKKRAAHATDGTLVRTAAAAAAVAVIGSPPLRLALDGGGGCCWLDASLAAS